MTLTPTQNPSTDIRRLVRPAMRAAIDRLDAGTRRACGYHLGFWDANGRPEASASGKGLRPTLAVLSALAAGVPAEEGVPAAVACELVHNFSLLHDDVIDKDTERRHRATVWARFGVADAILAGDALLALANEVLGEVGTVTVAPAVARLSATVRRLIAGQSADVSFEKRDDVTLEECLTMAADKTAALLACSASLGSVLAGAPATLTSGLATFGHHLGMAFQLTDDLLGIWGDPAVTGKPVLSDVRARKKTAPVVVALTSRSAAGERLRALYVQAEPLADTELAEAAALVEESGGRGWTEAEVDRQIAAGVAALAPLPLPAEVRAGLTSTAYQVRGRDR
ncbi:polyprenyl synthetase family protein [Actinopolymorpha alba]|uniref:polyprenyl synthetase family protein n=1 Tax=Actinopolymorpha alba TaxID=533267 RepID=UPI00036B5A02|nr:polyprenyl synthetase family protein [Actinopolymorpha alba]